LENNPQAFDLLKKIWATEKQALNLSFETEKSVAELINRFFNPFRRSSSLVHEAQRLPEISDLPYFKEELLNLLLSNSLVVIFGDKKKKSVTLTPEGAILANISLFSAQNSVYDLASLSYFDNFLYNYYRSSCLKLAQNVSDSLSEEKDLGIKQLSISLFLLINGSIGESKAFSIESRDAEKAAENVISAFVNANRDVIKQGYAFNWYLTTANKVMDDVFYNKKPRYYIYEEKAERVVDIVLKSAKGITDFRQRWVLFVAEYEKQRPLLKLHGVSFFSTSRLLDLEQKIFRRD
jgi:hypothetical protein